jgi:uncharacterized membrane protein
MTQVRKQGGDGKTDEKTERSELTSIKNISLAIGKQGGNMKEKAYKKEIVVTIVFIILYLLMGHTASLFVLFPGLKGGTMWGFPIHYIVPVLTGWFGMVIIGIIAAVVCNKLDDEIEAANKADEAAGKGGE